MHSTEDGHIGMLVCLKRLEKRILNNEKLNTQHRRSSYNGFMFHSKAVFCWLYVISPQSRDCRFCCHS